MVVSPKILLDYETQSGKCPVREWLNRLDAKTAARVEARLERVTKGNLGDVKPVGEGVSELRIPFGPGYRVYLGQHGQTFVILLCGGDKGSQSKDIKQAKDFWKDFKRRNHNA